MFVFLVNTGNADIVHDFVDFTKVAIFFVLKLLMEISYAPTLFLLKVWAIADSKRLGFLGFSEFVTAMQVNPRKFSSFFKTHI